MLRAPHVYLAGPDVFLSNAAAIADAKKNLCEKYGFVGVSPVDNEIDISGIPKTEAMLRISAANEQMILQSQLVIANLTPFRGPSADVGTAYEMGFARGLGLPIFGYTNASGDLLERTRQELRGTVFAHSSDRFEDANHMAIENFGGVDNLMLVGAIHRSDSEIIVESDFT